MAFFKELRRKIRYYIIRPTKNLIAWYPIIRDDWNFDYNGIYKIIEFKLNRQAKYFEKYGMCVGSDFAAERMKLCARVASDLQSERYTNEYMNYFHSQWHVVDVVDNRPKWEETILLDNFNAYFKKYAHAYREVTKTDKYVFENDTKTKIAMNMGIYLHAKAKRIFFKLLDHNFDKFSD
jgi:hypothetical protein